MERRERISTLTDQVVLRVNEYDNRTSPEDWPEALLITSEELHGELMEFADALIASDALTADPRIEGFIADAERSAAALGLNSVRKDALTPTAGTGEGWREAVTTWQERIAEAIGNGAVGEIEVGIQDWRDLEAALTHPRLGSKDQTAAWKANAAGEFIARQKAEAKLTEQAAEIERLIADHADMLASLKRWTDEAGPKARKELEEFVAMRHRAEKAEAERDALAKWVGAIIEAHDEYLEVMGLPSPPGTAEMIRATVKAVDDAIAAVRTLTPSYASMGGSHAGSPPITAALIGG